MTIIRTHAFKIDYESTAKELSDDTVTLTPKAIALRMDKLKALAKGDPR